MQIYETQIQVTQDDLDSLGHVNNVRYVQWVNDIAQSHWLKNATTEIISKYYWVLVSHQILYKNSAFLNEVVNIKTHVVRSKGARSTRIVEMYNSKSKDLLVKSETVWCLINSSTNKPVRITYEIVNLFN